MKYIYILIIAGLAACELNPHKELIDTNLIASGGGFYDTYQMDVDGCQYIRYYESITHKGNCSNPIHRCVTDTVYLYPAMKDDVITVKYGNESLEIIGDTTGWGTCRPKRVRVKPIGQ